MVTVVNVITSLQCYTWLQRNYTGSLSSDNPPPQRVYPHQKRIKTLNRGTLENIIFFLVWCPCYNVIIMETKQRC